MEYIIIRRTKFEGSSVSDMLSIQKTAKSLEEALKYTTALKMLETDKRVEFNILINIDNAFDYINRPLILKDEVAQILTSMGSPYMQVYGETRKKTIPKS